MMIDVPSSQLSHITYAFAAVNNITGEVYLDNPFTDLQIPYPGDSTTSSSSNTTHLSSYHKRNATTTSIPTQPVMYSNHTTMNHTYLPMANGTSLYGNLKALYLLKQKNRFLKTILSIGGWIYSPAWSTILASAEKRQKFATSAVALMKDVGFDGLDFDYEDNDALKNPNITGTAEQLVDLIRLTRSEMDMYAHRSDAEGPFLLTVSCPASPFSYKLLKLKEMDVFVDFWNLMAFDYSGQWSTHAQHAANLYPDPEANASLVDTHSGVTYFTKYMGIKPRKLNLGIPLYGHAFMATLGPGSTFNGTGNGSFGDPGGNWEYNALPRPVVDANKAAVTEIPGIGASYSYDETDKIMVSYDTPAIAKVKGEYIKEQGLGGAMWWELSQDRVKEEESLVRATVGCWKAEGSNGLEKSYNHLDYSESPFENLRTGMVHG
ncbi:putative glycosyl hydrolase, family 18 [Halenospora varia]|nr:putative glycosyl hydrolase, family 18 [Halenospora varia]